MLNGLRGAAQRLAFPNDSLALLAALLLANSLRLHFPHWATDAAFGAVAALLGLSLFRADRIFGARPNDRRQQGADGAELILTPLCFAALLALYGVGLAFDFSGQGLRNFTGLLCIAAVFLFCHENGAAWAQSRSAIAMLLLAAFAFLPLYWTSGYAHPVFLAVYLGYALLTVGILLAARCRSRKAQHLWAQAALLAAAAAALAFGSRALALAMLLALPFYWGAHFLLHRRGGALALAGGALALAGLASASLGSLRVQEALSELDTLGWSYTGGPFESARRILLRASMSGIVDAPWFGHGPSADVTKLPLSNRSSLAPEQPYCLHWANPSLLQDCRALLQARKPLAGAHSTQLWSWDFDQPIATWKGVELDGSPPRVVGLDLSEAHLIGEIPPVLGELRNLTYLNLSKNALTGAIPEALGNLANLEELHLHQNRLSGDIPKALTALGKLRRLGLSGNEFSAPAPAELRKVPDHDLDADLHHTPLSGCPEEMPSVIHRFLSPKQFPVCLPTWRGKTDKVGGYIYRINQRLNLAPNARLAESSHNLFLHIGVQSGLVGLGAVGLLCLSLILNLRRRGEADATPMQCCTAACACTSTSTAA